MPAVLARPAKLRPKPGESQVSFYARANKALRGKYHRQEARTARAHELWLQGGGERELQEIARQKFDPQKFTRIASRPVFAEHTLKIPTRGPDGRPTFRVEKYDRHALQQIADACNYRILDTGDFPPLVKGHTPSAEAAEQGAPQPDVLGYCGPFRLGMIGNKNPRWAIFQDEWVHNEDLPLVRKLARRSPEVWSDAPMAERIMDPVAALGADTPRLDLGMSAFHFSRTASGRVVTKYSAAAFPAGGNTSPPSFGGTSKRRYAAGADPMPDPAMGAPAATDPQSQISPELIKAFVAAMMQTAPMQWVAQQMQASESQADDGLDAAAGEPDGDELPPEGMDDAAPEGMDDDLAPEMGDEVADDTGDEMLGDDTFDGDPVEQVDESAPEPEMAADDDSDMDDEERTHYSAIPPQFRGHYLKARSAFRKRYEMSGGGGAPAMYSRSAGNGTAAALAARCARLESDLQTLRKNDRYSKRRTELNELSRTFQFDPKAEFSETCDLPQDQWEIHKRRIQTRYSRKANPSALPDLVVPGPKPAPPNARDKKTGEDRYHRRAMDLINARLTQRGAEPMSYDEALAAAKAEG